MSWKLSDLWRGSRRVWRTLAFRLTAAYASAGLLLVAFATLSLYLVLVSELNKSTDEFLQDKVNVLRTMLRERPDDEDGLHEEVELESAARRYEQFYICLLNAAGQRQMITPGMTAALNLAHMERVLGHSGAAIAVPGKDGRSFRALRATAAVGRSPDKMIIEVVVDTSRKEALLRRFRFWFWVTSGALLLLFPLVGYHVAQQGIRPVAEIAATARRITSSHLGERLAAEGYPYELAALALTFNKMLDGLESSFNRISRFSADIAHDLRTPVNNIRGEAEVALARARSIEEYRDALESSLEEAIHLSELIGNLLFLARTEDPLAHLRLERVNLTELLKGVQEYYEASAAEAGVTLASDELSASVYAEVDRTLIQRALSNLVSNAIAHTPEGGSVVLKAYADRTQVTLEVADNGEGIPPDALPRVFDRFFRVDPSRTKASGGTGLGLSIVQGIMQLHRGHVSIVSDTGHGTCVTLCIPTRPDKSGAA